MKTTAFLTGIILMIATAFSTNSNATTFTSEERSTGSFYGIIVNGSANVILTQGGASSVKIEGIRKVVEDVSTKIINGALVINSADPVDVYVTIEDLNLIEVNGSGKVYGRGSFDSDYLLAKVNGSGSIKVDVKSLSLGMIVHGSGKIIISGSAGSVFSRVVGSGIIYSTNLTALDTAKSCAGSNNLSLK